ncbi:hypothetical protein CGZ98_15270 [Enemella evansiae]|uniref:glycosyltransferase family 4 protein n=1 Tax=Enemella evansiae TaxID=2016499 RepID=UPI000B9668B1|nr:glycosyltransferase family 4 protein [Enemella evansiae]OYO09124.1 hypothetical protein CGZ98_15270 [Enemella evansiae]
MTDPDLVISAALFPPSVAGGGPVQSLAAVATAMARLGKQVEVLAADREPGGQESYPSGSLFRMPGVTVIYLRARTLADQLVGVARALWGRSNYALYLNSPFSPAYGMLPLLLVRLRRTRPDRVVLATRGQFMSNALAHHARRKQFALPLVRKVLFRAVDLYHATSEDEARELRSWVPQEKIRLIPNTRLPREPQPRQPDEGRLLYVGRIVPIKNVHVILEALRHTDRPIALTLAGPLEDPAYVERCRAIESGLPKHVRVEWLGTVDRDRVGVELARSSVFVHPTQGENFGHSIAEALEAGCPVVVGARTPWTGSIRGTQPSPGIVLDDPSDALAAWNAIQSLLDRDSITKDRAEEAGRAVARRANGPEQFKPYVELFFAAL